MSDTTKIEWATSTGNPWIGCTKVSPGCKNCYAATLDENRFSRTLGTGTPEKPVSHWGKGAPRVRTKGFWKDALRWNHAAQGARHHGGPCPRIFPSLCDWLDNEVLIEWLADFLKLIHDTPNLDWLLLTKRPEVFHSRLTLARNYLTSRDADTALWIHEWIGSPARPPAMLGKQGFAGHDAIPGKPPSNVWIGASMEDQPRVDERMKELRAIPAKIHFISAEPLLGPVQLNLNEINYRRNLLGPQEDDRAIDWVIVGGESGHGARPCNVEWIRSIVAQCKAAGTSCFVKQLGSNVVCENSLGWPDGTRGIARLPNLNMTTFQLKHPKGGDENEWPEDLRVRQFPKVEVEA